MLRKETECLSKIKFHHLHKLWGRAPAVGNIREGRGRKIQTESDLSQLVSPPVVKAVSFRSGKAVTLAFCGPPSSTERPHARLGA